MEKEHTHTIYMEGCREINVNISTWKVEELSKDIHGDCLSTICVHNEDGEREEIKINRSKISAIVPYKEKKSNRDPYGTTLMPL